MLVVSGSHWSRETAVMAVEALASQLSTRWSTLLLSSSAASGLRHHQQQRSMTSQPRPGPCRPACPHETERPAARIRVPIGFGFRSGACKAWYLEARVGKSSSSLQSPVLGPNVNSAQPSAAPVAVRIQSEPSLGLKFTSKSGQANNQTTGSINEQKHTLFLFLRAN